MTLRKIYMLGALLIVLISGLCILQFSVLKKNYKATSTFYREELRKVNAGFPYASLLSSLEKINREIKQIVQRAGIDSLNIPGEIVTKIYGKGVVYYIKGTDSLPDKRDVYFIEPGIRLVYLPAEMQKKITTAVFEYLRQTMRDYYEEDITSYYTQQLARQSLDERIQFEIDATYFVCRDGRGEYLLLPENSTAPVFGSAPNKKLPAYDSIDGNFHGEDFQMGLRLKNYWEKEVIFILKKNTVIILSSVILSLLLMLACIWTVKKMYDQKKLDIIKDDFINNISHEFKTPVATINVAAGSLTKAEVQQQPDELKYLSDLIMRQSDRLSYLFDTMLNLSLNDEQQVIEAVDLHAMIENNLGSINLSFAGKKEMKISRDFSATNPFTAASKEDINTVFINLFNNSIKYGGPDSLKLKIRTYNEAGKIIIEISDNGKGINQSDMPYVFKKFYRGGGKESYNTKGLGLGLFYVKKIIDKYKGIIKIKSELNKGVVIIIELKELSHGHTNFID